MVDSAPMRYINLTDSVLEDYEGQILIRILLSRQRAFAHLGLMDSVLSAGVRIRALAGEYGDSLSMAKSLLYIKGAIPVEQQRLFEPYLEPGLRLFRKEGKRYEQGVILGLMGFVQTRGGNVGKAVEYLQEARRLFESMDSARALYPVMLNLGNSYSALGQFTEAGYFAQVAFNLAKRINDSLRMAIALQTRSIIFQAQRKSDSSIVFLKESARYVPATAGAFLPLQLEYNLAEAYRIGGFEREAEQSYRRVKDGFHELGSQEGVSMSYRGLALLYGGSGRLGEAIGLMERSIRGLDSVGNRIQLADQYQEMADLYKKAGRFAEALEVVSRLKELKDSLFSEDKRLVVQQLEYRYQIERREEENRNLQAEVQWKNILSIGLSAILLLLGLFALVLRQRNHYSRELNRSYERLINRYIQDRDAAQLYQPDSNHPDILSLEAIKNTLDEPREDSRELKELFERLLFFFQQEKLYLNPDLSLDILAERLGISTRKLTQVLKSGGDTSYARLVNEYRVSEASRLLENPENKHFKLEAIAAMSGFSNRQHFRRVFEQLTGVNPKYYREAAFKQNPETDSREFTDN